MCHNHMGFIPGTQGWFNMPRGPLKVVCVCVCVHVCLRGSYILLY